MITKLRKWKYYKWFAHRGDECFVLRGSIVVPGPPERAIDLRLGIARCARVQHSDRTADGVGGYHNVLCRGGILEQLQSEVVEGERYVGRVQRREEEEEEEW